MRWIDPPDGRPWALLGLAGASLVLNAVLGVTLALSPGAPECPQTEPVAVQPVAPAGSAVAAVAAPAEPVVPEGVELVHAVVDRNLAYTFQQADAERGDVINAVTARLFWWDLDLRSDLQRGDEVTVAFEWDGELAHVVAASYDSRELGRDITAYRFQATGDVHPSWWSADGTEVPYRLKVDLMPGYEQITAVVNSRHRHHGIDLKTPVGTDVWTPRSGTVVRTDWNWKYNGNAVEVRYDDGTLARFLHLSETAVEPGQRLAAGARIGASGNTGRSTAPHLHYELERDGKVLDPFEYHGRFRRTLPEADRASFDAERERLDAALAAAISDA